jgi:putative methyltransferase (TIGR04325 family)
MGLLKNTIKALLPPLIFNIFRKFKPLEPTLFINKTWSGNYANWHQAQSQCTGYDSNVILEKCKSSLLKVKNGEAVYERDSVLFDEIQYSFGLLAGLERAALENDGILNVVDFGGSLGSTYFQNLDFLKSCKSVAWNIVEQAHFVECGKQFFEDENLKFYHSIEDCMKNCKINVLLLSGVLQYLDNPHEVLKKFVDYGFPFIILDRTSFVEGIADILTIQDVPDDIYKASYPAWFFNKLKLEEILLKNYKLISYFDNGFTPPTIINGINKVYWNGIILRK